MDKNTIADQLFQLARIMRINDDNGFRINAIVKGAKAIQEYDGIINSGKDCEKNIKGVGKSIGGRVDEIINTGTLAELSCIEADDEGIETYLVENEAIKRQQKRNMVFIKALCRAHGMGPKRAKQYVDMGLKSFDDVIVAHNAGTIKVPAAILVGMEYADDCEERIPRFEIDTFKYMFEQIRDLCFPNLIFEISGSYRRGQSHSGDIDLLITDPNTNVSYLKEVKKVLYEHNIMVADLTKEGTVKYMAICQVLEGMPCRRIDIRWINYESFGPGLLYFTGSQEFNIWMRNYAIAKGFSLSEYGLKEDKETHEASDEQYIFDLMAITYIPPYMRNKEFSIRWDDYLQES
jgi:DNA polymerase/3'-5' exonuclease PolX